MNKTILWVAAVTTAILLIYFLATKLIVLPWLGNKVAAVIVAVISLVSGLFIRKKRNV